MPKRVVSLFLPHSKPLPSNVDEDVRDVVVPGGEGVVIVSSCRGVHT